MNEQPDPNEKIRELYRKNFSDLIMLAPHLFDDKVALPAVIIA